MSSEVSLQVSKELVVPLIEQQVSAAIAAQLGDPAGIIQELVRRQLNRKVDSRGEDCSYSSAQPFLTHLAAKHLQNVVSSAMQTWINQNRDKLEALVLQAMNKNAKGFAKSLVDALMDKKTGDLQIKVDMSAKINDAKNY